LALIRVTLPDLARFRLRAPLTSLPTFTEGIESKGYSALPCASTTTATTITTVLR
jgi:hypothetical protein